MRLSPRQPLRPGGFVTIGLPPEFTLTNAWLDLGDSPRIYCAATIAASPTAFIEMRRPHLLLA
jgi:hypothetical protein